MKKIAYLCLITALFASGCSQETQQQETKPKMDHHPEKQADHQHGAEHGGHHHDKNKSNAFMNKMSFDELVARFDNPERDDWQKPEEVIAGLGDLTGKTVMDIGAGTGYFSFRLAAHGANVIAADVDERFQEYIEAEIEKRGVDNVSTRLVPFDGPKLENEEADIALIVDTYHHLENRPAYLKKVLAGLKPGGRFVVVDFKKEESPFGPPASHRIMATTVKEELEKAGFMVDNSDDKTLLYQYILTGKKQE